jgi:hypothetical protein
MAALPEPVHAAFARPAFEPLTLRSRSKRHCASDSFEGATRKRCVPDDPGRLLIPAESSVKW